MCGKINNDLITIDLSDNFIVYGLSYIDFDLFEKKKKKLTYL